MYQGATIYLYMQTQETQVGDVQKINNLGKVEAFYFIFPFDSLVVHIHFEICLGLEYIL